MRYTAELAARAAAYLARPLADKRSAEGLAELAAVWGAIQGQPPAACRQCQFSERARDVAAYAREFLQLSFSPATMSDTQPTSKYQLAPAYANQSFVHEDFNGVVTADNLTDEAAEFFIGKGRSDAFVLRTGSAAPESKGPAAGGTTDVTPANSLVPEADLIAEQNAHEVTKQALTDEKEHGKAALKSEKEAHKATKKELSEVSKQLTVAQKQLGDLAGAAEKAADKTGSPAT